jgi:large subunit ribosomal protein L30
MNIGAKTMKKINSTQEQNTNEKKEHKVPNPKLIVLIRIKGCVLVRHNFEETLSRLRLRRKYACSLVMPTTQVKGMIEKVKYYIAYGEIDETTLEKLLQERAQKLGDKHPKINAKEIAKELMQGKKLTDFGLKPFFRLHPPRKGIDSKEQYPKGVLGNNKSDINKLIERML